METMKFKGTVEQACAVSRIARTLNEAQDLKEGIRILLLEHTIPTLEPDERLADDTVRTKKELENTDMSIALRICMESGIEDRMESTLVSEAMLEETGLTEDEAFKRAIERLERETEIYDIFAPEMIVLTNRAKYCGAAALFSQKIREKVSREYGSRYMLCPSSRHEVIIAPMKRTTQDDIEEMSGIVRSINSSQVDEDDRLSDRAYGLEFECSEDGSITAKIW